MNLHRGFHGLLIILWVLYMGAILLWPFPEAEEQTDTAISVASVAYEKCLNAIAGRSHGHISSDDFRLCEAQRQKALKDMDVGLWMVWKDLWRHSGWHVLWIVPAVLLIPPLIVYGIIWLLVRVSLWVVGGFRESRT
jgi:hypothetical protein